MTNLPPVKQQTGLDSAGDERKPMPTHLFTLHLWAEKIDSDSYEWRGRLKHVESREMRYFRDTESLYGGLLDILADVNPQLPVEEGAKTMK